MRQAGSFQNFSYNFDPSTGNLTSRTDEKYNKSESFTYDGLNRLLTYNGYSATYDNYGRGNITSKSDVGSNFAYNTSGKPYAISGVTTTSNAIPICNQSVTYTSFDRPNSISDDNYEAEFEYNGNGERYFMNIVDWDHVNDTFSRYYIADCFESDISITTRMHGNEEVIGHIVETKEKLYLGGDYYSAPAVYVKEDDGDWNIYYICRDYLGSITQITNSSGSVTQELSYDAWGRLRNPSTLAVYAPGSEPTLFLGRGYTGHEHLPQFGLINMNARLYDPAVGRFLSPDPYVQFPDFSQSFNRYSYALNNPLKYTDLSGEKLNPLFPLFAFLLSKFYHDGYKANGNETNISQMETRTIKLCFWLFFTRE
jgi:RHS repeat-associated protein